MPVISFAPIRRRPPAPSESRKSPKALPTDLRQTYTLSPEERLEFAALWPQELKAFKFWQRVAAARGLDYTTLIGSEHSMYSFTAMPIGHGKHWCWPEPLKLEKKPKLFPHLVKENRDA
jgi:hypothetical protein